MSLPYYGPPVAPNNTHLDERDTAILAERVAAYDKITGPRVGDFVSFIDDDLVRRFSHKWDNGLQTSPGGSYHLGNGYISMSGGLDSIVPFHTLTDTGETREGSVWFFHHDFWGAHRGVDALITFRVYTCALPRPWRMSDLK